MAIVKVLSRHSPSYASLIKYILRYIVNDKKTNTGQTYCNNLRSNTISGYIKEFVENETFRKHTRTDQIHLFHEIVSFGADENKDIITPAMIDDLAREYMRLRGNTGVILGAPHFDKNHVHLHFCVSALHYRTGMSFGLKKSQMLELKQSFQHYHKKHYPELTKSAPNHGNRTRYISHAEWRRQQRTQIIEKVQECIAHAKSQQEFFELLGEQQLFHYERNGKPTGIEYDGLKFRFSRLLGDKQFDSLPIERSEEEKALVEIQEIRDRQREFGSREVDIEDRAR